MDERATVLLNRPQDAPTDIDHWIHDETRSQLDRSAARLLPRQRRQLLEAGILAPGTGGLVVLTLDRKLAQRIMDCEQEYLVQVDVAPDSESLKVRFAQANESDVKVSRQGEHQLRIILRKPGAAEIDKLCTDAGIAPVSIRRIRIGRMALGKLEAGQWRLLLPMERF